MLIRELMTAEPICLREDDSVDLAEKFMSHAHVRHLPVVDKDHLVGLVTHRDLLAAMATYIGRSPDPEQKKSIPVQSIMRRDVSTIAPDCDVRDAIQAMLDHQYGCLPVVEHERLVGIVTEADFLKLTRMLLNTEVNRETIEGAEV